MIYTVKAVTLNPNHRIAVVGCGGTGGFVAEGLCRLLIGKDTPIILIDGDIVEPPNLLRQNFYKEDVGSYKSEALAKRLSRKYNRLIGYSVLPFDGELEERSFGRDMYTPLINGLIIGCVDSPESRRAILYGARYYNWWLDAGNGFSSGQVLIGNASSIDELSASFDDDNGFVHKLPMPSLQLPSLLVPQTVDEPAPMDCAEAVEANDQSPVINQAMATLILEFVYRFLNGNLTWMGAYIDLEAGTRQVVPARPETVAKMCSIKVDSLLKSKCSIGKKHLPVRS